MSKLYVLEISYKAYVLADDEFEAKDFKPEVVNWEDPDMSVHETQRNELSWSLDCLVYNSGPADIKLGDVLGKEA